MKLGTTRQRDESEPQDRDPTRLKRNTGPRRARPRKSDYDANSAVVIISGYPQMFNPEGEGIPLVTIALYFTAVRDRLIPARVVDTFSQIQHALEEWSTGERIKRDFSEELYYKEYETHLRTLEVWSDATQNSRTNLCGRLRGKLYGHVR